MVEFRRDPDGTLWSYEEGVRIARVVTAEDMLLEKEDRKAPESRPSPESPPGAAALDERILNAVMEILTEASGRGTGAVWAAYNSILQEHGTDWQTLAAVTIVSSELFWKHADKENSELGAAFQAMNDMAFDYARVHAEEMDDYSLFRRFAREWTSDIRW